MIKIFNIVGARPQFIKAAAIIRAIKTLKLEVEDIIVHSGQHYDKNMSEVFFEELNIPQPKYNLNIGGGTHGYQTARMIEGFEELILKEKPDCIIVYGDTNTTLAGALAASKLHVPVVHIEAGLRSFNKYMPEEINRILTDHVSTLLFSPTTTGINNLKKEGFNLLTKEPFSKNNPGIFNYGDIMFDNTVFFSKMAKQKYKLQDFNLSQPYILLTIHRDFNTNNIENIELILNKVVDLSNKLDMPIFFPAHPRIKNLLKDINIDERIIIHSPLSFLEMAYIENNADLIITDSGGVQKEAYFLKKPCIIMRKETEWVELVDNGYSILFDPKINNIYDDYCRLVNNFPAKFEQLFGDGKAAEAIVKRIISNGFEKNE